MRLDCKHVLSSGGLFLLEVAWHIAVVEGVVEAGGFEWVLLDSLNALTMLNSSEELTMDLLFISDLVLPSRSDHLALSWLNGGDGGVH